MASLITSKVRTERLARIIRQFPRETMAEVDTWLNKNVRALISSSGKIPGLLLGAELSFQLANAGM